MMWFLSVKIGREAAKDRARCGKIKLICYIRHKEIKVTIFVNNLKI